MPGEQHDPHVHLSPPACRLLPVLALAASGLALTGCVVAPAYPGDVVYAPWRAAAAADRGDSRGAVAGACVDQRLLGLGRLPAMPGAPGADGAMPPRPGEYVAPAPLESMGKRG